MRIALKLIKQAFGKSANYSDNLGSEIKEMEKKVKALTNRFHNDSRMQNKYFEENKETGTDNDNNEDIERVAKERGRLFSQNYISLFKDMINFQNNDLAALINKLKKGNSIKAKHIHEEK